MTEVLQFPIQPEGHSYYQTAGPQRSNPSSTSVFLDNPPSSLSSNPKENGQLYADRSEHTSTPTPAYSLPISKTSSSSTISDAASDDSSLRSNATSRTALTLETDLDLPDYNHVSFSQRDDNQAHSSSGYFEDSSDTPTDTSDTTISDSTVHTPTVADDTAVKQEPTRQVDFLSHEWREEDIWSSWRHIVSQRKTIYGERSRLENASWRTWAKTKFDLRTVSPEKLNWLKESDVTWLYGPLKQAASYPITQEPIPDSQISRNSSFINKKPILKKRSMSEVMLQKSISTSSLIKQAADRVQAQGRNHRRMGSNADIVDSKLQSETPSRDQVDYFTSRSTSSGGSPGETHEKRHIRFDERVEQCIAIECKDPGPDVEDESEGEETEHQVPHSDSSSDDGVVMMKRKKTTGLKRPRPHGSRSSSTSGRKIIETLPATTLKYRTDSPDITAEAKHHTFGRSWSTGTISPSPSQETLRPSNPATNFLIPDDDGEDVDSDSSWSFGASNPKSSLGASFRSGSSEYEMGGMRRTNSGMFMPGDEDDIVATGLLGRVSETINTARDIAHVIWNVGWRS